MPHSFLFGFGARQRLGTSSEGGVSKEEPGALLGSSKVCFAGRGGYRGVKCFWLPLCVWRVLSLESEPGESELLPERGPGWVGGCPSNATGAGKALVNRDQLDLI